MQMTTYTVHPLVSEGVIKGAKVVEKPQTTAGNYTAAYSLYQAALHQSIASALPFENQDLIKGLFHEQAPNAWEDDDAKMQWRLKDGLYDSLTWTVQEVEQYRATEKIWRDWRDGFHAPFSEIANENKRTVLRLVEEK